MLAGALYGLRALPQRWLKQLDPAVRSACARQARELAALATSIA
jgi:ADP-ribosyl-[dinitrogen reductase] hydrolase